MGGKALKIPLKRLSRADFHALQSRVLPYVSTLYAHTAVPHSLPTKLDFGDLDILVTRPQVHDPIPQITTHFKSREVLRNGPITCFEVDNFQVDLIYVKPELFDTGMMYFSWGDLGMMMGVLGKKLGVKYGQFGLTVPVSDYQVDQTSAPEDSDDSRSDVAGLSKHLGEIHVSTSPTEILTFLGFDAKRFNEGFATQEEIFNFMTSSTNFHPSFFSPTAPHMQNHANRTRTRLRPMWNAFLSHCLTTSPPPGSTCPPALTSPSAIVRRNARAAFRADAIRHFNKQAEWDALFEKERLRVVFKKKFGGGVVGALTGKEGRELGEVMKRVREELFGEGTDRVEMWRRVEGMNEEDVKAVIFKCNEECNKQAS
ncbi:hypothetical protein HDV00_009408 [Rhizophlyctis rosea]|nr:hypothetical protein HDV00_009408 [Rhizophlyctis rosea]